MRFRHGPSQLERGHGLRATDGGEALQELVERIAGLKIIVERLDRNPCPDKHRRPAQDFRSL